MRVDLAGRVDNMPLSYGDAMVPLYEAIVNAIHAIDDAKPDRGKISVVLERDAELLPDEESRQTAPIISCTVRDNGIGFTDQNFDSFSTSDSGYKRGRGGKGVARLTWLKAFQHATIGSFFQRDGQSFLRKFRFGLPDGISHAVEENALSREEFSTTVQLVQLRPGFREKFPRRLDTVARHIVEHCFVYFLLPTESMPDIVLEEEGSPDQIDLKAFFAERYKKDAEATNFHCNGSEFSLQLIRLSSDAKGHRIHFCAHSREVVSTRLERWIPNLRQNLHNEDGRVFFWSAVVSGKFLDDHVRQERSGFQFPEAAEADDSGQLEIDASANTTTLQRLEKVVADVVKERIQATIQSVQDEKMHRIQERINGQRYMFRPLLKFQRSALEDLPPNLSDADLDTQLFKLYATLQAKIRADGEQVLAWSRNPEDTARFQSSVRTYLEQANEIGLASLAEYVVYRKAVLDMLESSLERDAEGKYANEDVLHNIIFPMRRTSVETVDASENQNLWILDERLSYHVYLASDLSMNRVAPVQGTQSRDRPDLVVFFDRPHLFSEPLASPNLTSVVIVEFKKPMRNHGVGESSEKNPVDQVLGYVKEIRSRQITNARGRPLDGKSARFYCYIVCDIVPEIEELAETRGMQRMLDGNGFHWYNSTFNAYLEILSYTKLLEDAKKRNRILFHKLNIPHS